MQFRPGNAALALVATAMLCGFAAVAAAEPDMNAINAMDRAAFVQKFGGIFEKSPWVAEKVWEKRPFASIDDLHAAMVNIVKHSPVPNQLALLQSHPDLAGNALSKAEIAQIADLNAAYKQKFGFPFIIAVRMHTKEGIFFEFNRRLQNETQAEFANDLQNVYAITRLRLGAI
jgi:2-oxo-4-hydroxy-4-carboxy-5-ureidoimidazoline decarboxylase